MVKVVRSFAQRQFYPQREIRLGSATISINYIKYYIFSLTIIFYVIGRYFNVQKIILKDLCCTFHVVHVLVKYWRRVVELSDIVKYIEKFRHVICCVGHVSGSV